MEEEEEKRKRKERAFLLLLFSLSFSASGRGRLGGLPSPSFSLFLRSYPGFFAAENFIFRPIPCGEEYVEGGEESLWFPLFEKSPLRWFISGRGLSWSFARKNADLLCRQQIRKVICLVACNYSFSRFPYVT